MKQMIDTRDIVDIHYVVKVGDTHFEFETGEAALKFAKTARVSCSETTWDDQEYRITIELFPIWREEPEEELQCDEQLEKECEA